MDETTSWRNAEMALRWTATSVLEAQKTFHRLNECRQRPILGRALAEYRRRQQAGDVIETIMTAA